MLIPIGDDIERNVAPFQFLTILFIFACFGAFAWEISLPPDSAWIRIVPFTLIPSVLMGYGQLPPELAVMPAVFTMFTSLFLHGGWEHILGNMLFLWVFGSSIEEATGHFRFILLYLLCGLAASMGHVMVNPASDIPTLGASGAISGLMGAYILVYPFNKIKMLLLLPIVMVIRIPALVAIGFWIVYQCYEIWMASTVGPQNEGGGVAWTAHVAGFVAGMFLIPILRRRGVRLMSQPESI